MLLRFSAQNHLSFRDEIEISLVATALKDSSAGLIPLESLGADKAVLPAAVVYGPNAAGKSNVIAALSCMRTLVTTSHISAGPDDVLPYLPFALDAEHVGVPTAFSLDFVKEGIRYNYSFSFDAEAIQSEVLYSFPFGRPQMLFERVGRDFKFGRKLRGRNHVIADLTRANSLFLSAAAQNDHDDLTPLFRYFSEMVFSTTVSVPGVASPNSADEIDRRAILFLDLIGTGVVDFQVVQEVSSETSQKFLADLRSVFARHFNVSETLDLTAEPHKIQLGHQRDDGSVAYLDFARESAGTRRLLFLLTDIFRVLDKGGMIFVDELDASLHTQAFELVLALFCHRDNNKHGAQILATVHDTNILNCDFIRRDQVWFAQKDSRGATELYSLSDIKLRGSDNFEKGYLQGRFGAMPSSSSVQHLLWKLRSAL